MKKMIFWLECTRAYALPMSIMAWAIPFSLGYFNGGKIFYGLIALLGIIFVHLGGNLFDDVIDYKSFLKNKKENDEINLKKGKCKYFLDGSLSVSKALIVCVLFFVFAALIGLYFIYLYKLPILILMMTTGILCLFYPKSGYLGLSEIVIGTIFSPLLFTGVYYVMTGSFSQKLEWMSISFAFVAISLLYTDFFLDYNSDKKDEKRTLPVLSGSKNNAYYLYIFLIFLIYANLFLGIHAHVFSAKYLIIFLSVFSALKTIGNLQHFVDNEITNQKEFLSVMNDVQKFVVIFAFLTIIAFYLK